MITVNTREARSRMSELLDEAEHGTVIEITRRGKVVARLVPAGIEEPRRLPDLGDFRAGIEMGGEPMSATIRKSRNEERL